jgi:hypothetical protein
MHWIRNFSAQEGHVPTVRNVEDAPQPMRQELVDVFFGVAEQNPGTVQEGRIHRVICQSLGVGASANPYGGYRYAAGRDIRGVDWQRVYDLIARLWPEFQGPGLGDQFREGVNRVLAAHGSAWDLGADGRLYRVLPEAAHAQLVAAVAELANPRYAPAAALFNAARDAYDDRPRRDRDACSNAFDAMESVAKEKYGLPDATFGQVVAHIRQAQALNEQIIGVLEAINTLRNKNFGHGMAAPFALSPAEVDFTYLACIGAILLLTRTP